LPAEAEVHDHAAVARDFVVAFAFAFAFALAVAFDFPGAPAAAAETAGKTRRATHMDVRRFLPRQEVASENPVGGANPKGA
jgi:hypothetical protein